MFVILWFENLTDWGIICRIRRFQNPGVTKKGGGGEAKIIQRFTQWYIWIFLNILNTFLGRPPFVYMKDIQINVLRGEIPGPPRYPTYPLKLYLASSSIFSITFTMKSTFCTSHCSADTMFHFCKRKNWLNINFGGLFYVMLGGVDRQKITQCIDRIFHVSLWKTLEVC